jgi:leucyl aminopeptidase
MKELIKLNVRTQRQDAEKCKVDLLAVGMFAGTRRLDALADRLDRKLRGAIKRVLELGDFKGKEAASTVIYSGGAIAARRVMLVGLGDKKEPALDALRKAAATVAGTAVNIKARSAALCLHQAFPDNLDLAEAGRAITEGVFFGSYRYDEFVSGSEDGRSAQLQVTLLDSDPAKVKLLQAGWQTGEIIGRAQSYARTLANRPGNLINPAALAEEAAKLAAETAGLTCTVLDEKKLAAKQMNGILAVGSGSQNKPRLIILQYKGADEAADAAIALVGKAITFDSGGICIKPSANLDQMKFDKSGGIAVLATLKAVAELKLKLNVWGLVPAAENMPSGTSYRPGDIIKTYSGKTVEVQNTDAEGRMILCDALAYAAEQQCDPIIDMATLTGACMVALGRYHAGLMGNSDELMKQLQQAATDSGEKVWLMPSGREYLEEMKSKIADLKNIGSKWGGACTGAAFLGQFVGKAKWAHLDIAGMDLIEKTTEFAAEGSSGYGVRLLTAYLINRQKINTPD